MDCVLNKCHSFTRDAKYTGLFISFLFPYLQALWIKSAASSKCFPRALERSTCYYSIYKIFKGYLGRGKAVWEGTVLFKRKQIIFLGSYASQTC